MTPVLKIGLTGGIGSGKSTVARRLVERGAVLVDSDVLAREVVAAGTGGLAAVVAEFGERVLRADGELDRPALAGVVFGDAGARSRLNAIVHPLVRVRRLEEHRGMPEPDARSRIAAQADDEQRRAAADVWLDNSGTPDALVAAVDALVDDRLLAFEDNLRHRRVAPVSSTGPVAPPDAARIAARIAAAAGDRGRGVERIGPGALPGTHPDGGAPVQLQLAVAAPGDIARTTDALAAVGLPPLHDPDAAGGSAVVHCGAADPGQPVELRICVAGSDEWRHALLLRDWLSAVPEARGMIGYGAHAVGSDGDVVHGASSAAEEWAVSSGWSPSLG